MWKEYSWNHMKNNGPSNIAVMAAAFISALLLSLSGSVFYNSWNYEIRRLIASEGNWHGRITGEPAGEELERIRTFPNVEEVKIGEGEDGEIVTDICFKDKRTAFRDMGEIAQSLGIEPEKVTSHYSLLAMYLIRDPADPAPRAVFPLLLTVTVMACVSLIMIIHNAFGISMHARIRQIGILSSIGATPGQIRTCLLQEAAALCAGPVAAGTLLGILGSVGLIGMTNAIAENVPGRFRTVWTYHPLLLILTLFLTTVTIGVSAWIPARKVSAEKEKKLPCTLFFVRSRGGACGKCAESPEKSAPHGFAVIDCGLSGVFCGTVLFHSHEDQPGDDLFCQISGCVGYHGEREKYVHQRFSGDAAAAEPVRDRELYRVSEGGGKTSDYTKGAEQGAVCGGRSCGCAGLCIALRGRVAGECASCDSG